MFGHQCQRDRPEDRGCGTVQQPQQQQLFFGVNETVEEGVMAKNAIPASSQPRRPQRSDNMPIAGFSTIPVRVDTDTIKPKNVASAPRLAAKIGKSGVLPIWYPLRATKSAAAILASSRRRCIGVLDWADPCVATKHRMDCGLLHVHTLRQRPRGWHFENHHVVRVAPE